MRYTNPAGNVDAASRLLLTVLISASVAFYSCNSESSQIGSDFFRDGSLDVSSIDTMSVLISTIATDSLVTSGLQRVLSGSHTDDRLGKITAITYFKPSLNTTSTLPSSNVTFDHMSVVLKYDGYSYYDTASIQTLSVYQLMSEMEATDDGALYNATRFSLEDSPLGTVSFNPTPGRADSIEIILDNIFGEEFFSGAYEGASQFEDGDRFGKFIRGFAIIPDTTQSSSILGFKATPELRLYYRDRNVIPTEEKHLSYTAEPALVYTGITSNRENTNIQITNTWSRLPSGDTDDEAYMQAGAGLSLRVDMPYLRDLNQVTNFYPTRAVLRIQPVLRSYDDLKDLPDTLNVFIVDNKNGSLGEYIYDAYLQRDLTLGRDTWYEMDATPFVRSQMGTAETNENALVFLLWDEQFRGSVDRIYFAARSNLYHTQLTIYYATILNR